MQQYYWNIMNMRLTALFTICLCIVTVSTAKLPSRLKTCDRKQKDFDQCLTTAITDAFLELSTPIKEAGLPSLEPLQIPSLTIGAGTGAVDLVQNYKDVKVYGLSKILHGSDSLDWEKKILTIKGVFSELRMQMEYDVNGKILVLPVYGKGPGTITLVNTAIILTFNLEEYDKNNEKHFKVTTCKLSLDPKLITYNFENLFDGDKALGDNINKVLNENWSEVYADVRSGYEEAFAKVATSLFDNVLSRVSVSDLFGDQ